MYLFWPGLFLTDIQTYFFNFENVIFFYTFVLSKTSNKTTKQPLTKKPINMKKLNRYLSFAALLLVAIVIASSCKKDEDPIVPAFTLTSTEVTLVGNVPGVQFFAKCNNDDVKMTKVIISNPIGSFTQTYNLNGEYFVKNEIFGLQADGTGYEKSTGAWSFTFVGNRTADNVSFSVQGSLTISK